MDNQAIKDAFLAVNTALVDKIGKQPYIAPTLVLSVNSWRVGNGYLDDELNHRFDGPWADTPEDALSGALDAIRKLPSEAEQSLRQFQRKVAEAIDFGNEHGIEAQWLNPLVEMARKLAENALTYQGDQ